MPSRPFQNSNLRHKTIFNTSCICLLFMEVPGPVLLSLSGSFALFDFWAAASYVFLVLVLVILNQYSPSLVSAVGGQVGRRCSFCYLQHKILFYINFSSTLVSQSIYPLAIFLFFYGGSNLLLASFFLIFWVLYKLSDPKRSRKIRKLHKMQIAFVLLPHCYNIYFLPNNYSPYQALEKLWLFNFRI